MRRTLLASVGRKLYETSPTVNAHNTVTPGKYANKVRKQQPTGKSKVTTCAQHLDASLTLAK